MSAKNEAEKQKTVEGVSFDPASLMNAIMTTVDRFRSDVGTMPYALVDNTKDIQVEEIIESRLNCFYRLIGLPATRDLSVLNSSGDTDKSRLISQHGTINFVQAQGLQKNGRSVSSIVSSRETDLLSIVRSRTVEDNIKMLEDPLPLESLGLDQPIADQETNKLRKPSMFPMVVDAATPIFPIHKRVAPLFNDGDFVVSGSSATTRLPRPFLESIIYMRTNRFKTDESKKIADITANIQAYVQGLPSSIQLSPDQTIARNDLLKAIGIKDGQTDYTLIEVEIVNKFVQAIGQSAKKYKAVINDAKKLNQLVDFKPEPKRNAKEKSGNSTLLLAGSKGNPSIDERIKELEQRKAHLDMLITILPTNQVLQADTTYRILNNQEGFANITPDIFVSEFSSLLTFDQPLIDKQLREENAKRARHLQKFETLKRDIQYYSGEGQGLSIFDVLCTFLALFTMDLDKLVALLNNDARSRMLNSRFFSFSNSNSNSGIERTPIFSDEERLSKVEGVLTGTNVVSPIEALAELESLVKNNFKLAAAFFKEADKSGQNRKG